MEKMGFVLVKVKRFAKMGSFNPLSPLQVKAYLIERKIPLPLHRSNRDKNGERQSTTNDESLTELLREGKAGHGDKVLEGVLDARHTSKALGFLSEKYIYPDKKMRPVYTVKPKSGRLSAARPNLMQLPKGKKKDLIMKRASEVILSSIIAEPGYVLFSADWNAIEPSLIGYFAKDPDYARVGRLGSHAYVLSHYLKNPIDLSKSDAEVLAEMEALKAKYKTEYAICKTGNMAYLYLQGVMNMAKTLGLSVERTKEIRGVIDTSAPKVRKWKIDTLKMAHFQGRLTNPHGFTMSYFDIFKTEYGKVLVSPYECECGHKRDAHEETCKLCNECQRFKGMPVLGREAPEAMSFPAQSTGAAMLRKVIVDLGNSAEEGENFMLLIPEHDKLIGQVKEAHLDRILSSLIVPSMEREWPELGGLKIGVDVEVGPSMQVMEGWKR